jgi:hypothetical protein
MDHRFSVNEPSLEGDRDAGQRRARRGYPFEIAAYRSLNLISLRPERINKASLTAAMP